MTSIATTPVPELRLEGLDAIPDHIAQGEARAWYRAIVDAEARGVKSREIGSLYRTLADDFDRVGEDLDAYIKRDVQRVKKQLAIDAAEDKRRAKIHAKELRAKIAEQADAEAEAETVLAEATERQRRAHAAIYGPHGRRKPDQDDREVLYDVDSAVRSMKVRLGYLRAVHSELADLIERHPELGDEK